jgi:hypothetical protein
MFISIIKTNKENTFISNTFTEALNTADLVAHKLYTDGLKSIEIFEEFDGEFKMIAKLRIVM